MVSQTERAIGTVGFSDPAVIDPTTSKPYTPEASARQTEEIFRQEKTKKEVNKLQLPENIKKAVSEKLNLEVPTEEGILRPRARPEGLPSVYETLTPVDKVLELGYLLKEKQSGARGKTKIATGLDENNPEHQKTIKGFFDNAVGGDTGYDPTKVAWCAAFVNHILTEMGADLIKSKDRYKRLRANEYKNYGKPVELEDVQEGDIVVFDWNKDGIGDHVTFYAGGRIVDEGSGQYINVLGGNQGGGEVSVKENEYNYTLDNVIAIRRITYDGDAYKIAQSNKDSNPVFKTFIPKESKGYFSAEAAEAPSTFAGRNRGGLEVGYEKGGLSQQTKRAMGTVGPQSELERQRSKNIAEQMSTLSREENDEEKFIHPLETVPFFQRPKGSSTDDIQVGEDDAGNPVFQGRLGTYIVRLNPDQRTTRQKITEAIPTIKESVSEYLEDPKLPTKEQMGQFARAATIGAIEDLGETMFTPKGTLGDVFSLASGAGAASVPFDVPKGALRIFGGVGAEGTAKDKNLKKAIKLLKKSNVDPTNVQDSYFTNKKIWEQTGWYVDPKDGQWRFEIDDSKSNLKDFKSVFKTNKNPTDPADDPNLSSSFFEELGKVPLKREDGKYKKLNEVLEHEEFFRKYPDLKDVDVIFYSDPSQPNLLGSAGDDTISVNLSAFKNYEDIKSTLIHEIQHIVQYEEGFVRGASAKFIPNVLTEKKSKEIQTKIAPLKKEEEKLDIKLNAAVDQRKIMREQFANKPLKNLSESDQIAIYKLKPYNEEKMDYEGPSWASIARDYDVPVVEVREAYGRYRLLRHLDKEVNRYNLALNKISSDLYKLEQESFDIETNFYRGAGGEIEARLAQYRRNLSAKEREKSFPIDSRTTMLQQEGGKFEYTGKEGVDPYQYKVQPRREPEKEKGFLSGIKKKLGLSESRENPDIEPEVEDAFTKLADIQRGEPELAMVEAQKIYGGGVMPYALEHAGDLTHRMAERGGRFGAEFVAPKVRRLLDSLLSDYGFEKEMLENIQSNARFHYKGDNPNISFEEYKKEYENNIDKALNKYSEAHKKVPVYNRMQLAGREAAIAIGEKRYTDAIENLYIIDQAIKDGTYKQAALEFDPNIDFRKKPKDFNKGGTVMNRQMEMAFMREGGLKDDGMNVDPVSGNEVPPGSMAKEVRDDIPARLSEGEYVVPADVVQYYGVKFFEDLRADAKIGLQEMERNGRIGGEPVDDDLSDEEMMEIQTMMQGGMVQPQQQSDPYFQQNMMYQQPQGMAVGGAVIPNIGTGFSWEATGPGSTTPTVPETGETPETCAARGMVYNPETKMCEPAPVTAPVVTDTGGDDRPEPPTPEPWYEGITSSAEDSVNRYFGMGAKIGAGVVGFMASATPLGILGGGAAKYGVQGSNLAKARAEVALRTAAGDIEGAEMLQKAIDKAIKGTVGLEKADQFFENTFNASGERNVISALEGIGITVPDSIKSKDFRKDPNFDSDLMDFIQSQGSKIKTDIFKMEAKPTPKTKTEKAAPSVSLRPKARPTDPSKTVGYQSKESKEALEKVTAKTQKTQTAKSKIKEAAKKDPSAGIYTGGGPSGGFNKGGLMKKKKK